ncbi:MAG: hypothetical protein AAB368_02095 [bacterium]
MTYYVLTKDEELVGVTPFNWVSLPGVSVTTIEGPIPDLNRVTWNGSSIEVSYSTIVTKLDFLSRFTTSERITIQSSTDPIVKDAFNLLMVAEAIDITDQRTQMLVGYLAMTGIIANTRVVEVLA